MKHGQPNVYVVDSHYSAAPPPVPFRQRRKQRCAGGAQTMLFLLVSLALCGLAIEACLIYQLYHPKAEAPPSSSKRIGGKVIQPPSTWQSSGSPPSKPMAHLTGGLDAAKHNEVRKQHVMAWSTIAGPMLRDMAYKNGSLIVLTEGYYHVYSKVSFEEGRVFYHAIKMNTDKYRGDSITLLVARKYSGKKHEAISNSFLAGVFQLSRGDALFVEVSNTQKLRCQEASENVFGMFMI